MAILKNPLFWLFAAALVGAGVLAYNWYDKQPKPKTEPTPQ